LAQALATEIRKTAMSDNTLRQDILDELEFEPSVDATTVGVAVRDGVVTLTGWLESYSEKLAVERAVERIKGVKGIAQEIEVRPVAPNGLHDDEITLRAVAALRWSTLVPDGRVMVKVERGHVTLMGTLDWAYQKRGALDLVRGLRGVTAVTDLIELAERVASKDVKTAIEDALRRNAELEDRDVKVSVAGNRVTLEGRVASWRARRVVEDAAWSVAGVTEVTDQLIVG
jgi:osmotically-inducible protein OsmY